MTKTRSFVLATFLMASTSPLALAQTTPETTAPESPTGGAATTAPTQGITSGVSVDAVTDSAPGIATGTSAGTIDPDMSTDTPTGTGTTTGGSGTTASATGENPEHRLLITSLNLAATGPQDWQAEFEDMSEDSEIRIVKLSDLRASDDTENPMLDQAMSALEDSQDALRAAVESRDRLTSALKDASYTVDDVVGGVVQAGDTSEVTLIVEDEGSTAN